MSLALAELPTAGRPVQNHLPPDLDAAFQSVQCLLVGTELQRLSVVCLMAAEGVTAADCARVVADIRRDYADMHRQVAFVNAVHVELVAASEPAGRFGLMSAHAAGLWAVEQFLDAVRRTGADPMAVCRAIAALDPPPVEAILSAAAVEAARAAMTRRCHNLPRTTNPPWGPLKPAAPAKPAKKLPAARLAILRQLATADEPLVGKTVAKRAGYAPDSLRRHFVPLQTAGLIEKVKAGYRITPAGRAAVTGHTGGHSAPLPPAGRPADTSSG